MMNKKGCIAVAILLTTAVTACASTSDDAAHTAARAIAPVTTVPPPVTTTTPPKPCPEGFDEQASFAPMNPLPRPGAMPAGTYMATIQANDRLRVGVDENTLYFSYRNPATGRITGFEADLARELARAIFGDPERIEFVSVVTDEKVPFVSEKLVDATISVVSMSCARWGEVSFSTAYYDTRQRILVRGASPQESAIKGLADLAGKKVCVTVASSSEKYAKEKAPNAIRVPVETRTNCLVKLQDGDVDAILLPNSILAGLHAQDPQATTFVEQDNLPAQHYGIAINHDYPEFVEFVNGLLEQWRRDGTLDALRATWIAQAPDLASDTFAPAPRYR